MSGDEIQEDVIMDADADAEKEVREGQEERNDEAKDAELEENSDDDLLDANEPEEDSDSGEDDEEGNNLEALQASLLENPYSYEAHVKLISAIRRAGLLEKLREAREAMNLLYPLTPDMWREWAQDESRLTTGVEDVRAVEALYERGVQECLSVSLWIEYLKFVEEHDPSVAESQKEGVSKMRNLYERALAATGLHFTEGGKVWEAYREFEEALLIIIDTSGGEGKAKQAEIVRSLFRRQLTIPSANLVDTLQEYIEWDGRQGNFIGEDLSGLPPHVTLAYQKALQLCGIRELFEEKIAKGQPGGAELLQDYVEYIRLEEATGEPARAQVLYERAVSAFPVNHDMWMKYTQYLESNLKVAPVLKGVYAKAVRSCPWVESLWKCYLLALERFKASDEEIAAVFEPSLLGGYHTAQEYLDLFLTRCDGLRRRIAVLEDGPQRQSDILNLHNTFDRTSQFITTYYPDFVDRTFQLHAYWADVEAHVMKDLVAARGVWEGLIKSSGWMTEVWQGYISMELSMKNLKEARAIYRQCYSRRLEGNGTEVMCAAWLRFEREHGSLEDYDRAAIKVAPRLTEVEVMQVQQALKSAQNGEPRATQKVVPEAKHKTGEQAGNSGKKQEKSFDSAPAEKRKRAPLETKGFKVPKPVLKKSKVEETPKAATSSGKDAVMVEASKKEKKLYTDECTAFVSNIAFGITEEQLREFFSSVAGVKEVRLLREKATGRPRGLAYVDFEDEESLAAAITKNQQELSGRQLTVARSAPTRGRGGSRGHLGGRGDFGHRGGHQQGRGHGEDSRGDGSRGGRALGSGIGHRRGGKITMTGSNTFAVPRNVARPLGWNPGQGAIGDEVMKSNDDFKKLLLSKK